MMKLREVLFWDTDINNICLDKHAAYIIERIAMFGTYDEWNQVLSYYGKEKIKKIVCHLSGLDNKTLNYLSIHLNIPKVKFKCYTQLQSIQKHFPS